MELAVIISLIALLVALPSCISDSLIVISKVRAYFKNRQQTYKKPLIFSKVLPLLKKIALFHPQDSVQAYTRILSKRAFSAFSAVVVALSIFISLPTYSVLAPGILTPGISDNQSPPLEFTAKAYSLRGRTASGKKVDENRYYPKRNIR